MKNLKSFDTIELSENEKQQTCGGFGLIPILFLIGMYIAYSEKN